MSLHLKLLQEQDIDKVTEHQVIIEECSTSNKRHMEDVFISRFFGTPMTIHISPNLLPSVKIEYGKLIIN